MSTPEAAEIERLTRIEVKLDNFITVYTDHETRLRKLERAVWIATGFATAAGGGLGALITQVMGA